jgi:hypothetical protein
MANTYKLIASASLSTTTATVTFSSISSSYTDLVLRASYRIDNAGAYGQNPYLVLNSDTSGYHNQFLQGNGSSISASYSNSSQLEMQSADSAGNTSNTFTIQEVYFYLYKSNATKIISQFKSSENDSSGNEMHVYANYYPQTTAISSILVDIASGSFVANSTFWLYGIKNS